jgi:hypothetical protein
VLVGTHPLSEFEAIHVRHMDIEQGKSNLVNFQLIERLDA